MMAARRKGSARIRLLLVDDHEVVRLGLRTLFARSSQVEVVGEAARVADAISEARRLRPAVVLMDLRLGDESGVDACRAILSHEPSTRVLFLTSYPDEQAVRATVLAGAAGYLLKEIGHRALIEAIEAVAAGQSILDPKVTQSVLTQLSDGAKAMHTAEALSPQEKRVLAHVVEGKTNKEIAIALGLSDKTIKNYLSNAFQKLQVNRRSHAAVAFTKLASRTEPR
ncbi:MAG: devR [Betaproteobacteria bacterium]|jgi:two-component system response regulator DevR|nr:devR [Betaproteobacteria bacterium]